MSVPDWHDAYVLLWVLLAIYAGSHALLSRRDPRTAWGWIAVCWLFPIIGPTLYFLFGINRLQTRARRLGWSARVPGPVGPAHPDDIRNTPDAARERIPSWLEEVARTADRLTQLPLLGGNRVESLHNGDEAYPRMLEAIDGAQHSVALTTYLFEKDKVGLRFVDALARARARGVDVRVLVDGIGLNPLRSVTGELARRGVPYAVFNPLRLFPPQLHINLRNHRKLLLVDGRIGFTGGMNIGCGHLLCEPGPGEPTSDVHFQVQGPVLMQLAGVFAEDWRLGAGENWPVPAVVADAHPDGSACRVIIDGPNEDFDHLAMVLQAAISAARQEVRIMTPYFLPPNELAAELQAAALRGVRVEVLLPAKNDARIVHWAMRNAIQDLLKLGVYIGYQPPPFCHSKLVVVDRAYAVIGSANLDARSLKLNFELGVEIYDPRLARELSEHCDEVRASSVQVTLEDIRNRPLWQRFRDALFWLFSPYL